MQRGAVEGLTTKGWLGQLGQGGFSCVWWLQGCAVGENRVLCVGQRSHGGVTVSCLTPVLLQCSGDPTLHLHRGGERSLGAGVGLPLPHPRNAVLCTHIPSEPPPAERQRCPWCLLACSWGFGTCPGLILQLSSHSSTASLSPTGGRGGRLC